MDHAATALEGVESPAQLDQLSLGCQVASPTRKVFVQYLQDLGGLLKEDLPQLVIYRCFIGQRWQQADRDKTRRRVEGRHRMCQHIGQ
ncbi:hypothetical protein D3C72_2235330 [compost metagenome]